MIAGAKKQGEGDGETPGAAKLPAVVRLAPTFSCGEPDVACRPLRPELSAMQVLGAYCAHLQLALRPWPRHLRLGDVAIRPSLETARVDRAAGLPADGLRELLWRQLEGVPTRPSEMALSAPAVPAHARYDGQRSSVTSDRAQQNSRPPGNSTTYPSPGS